MEVPSKDRPLRGKVHIHLDEAISDAAALDGGGGATATTAAGGEATKEFPKTGVTLAAFRAFVDRCGGASELAGLTTEEVCTKFLKPLTALNKSSYCDLLAESGDAGVGQASIFCSHAWRFKFLDVLSALEHHFSTAEDPDIIIWFDLFSNNQHLGPTYDFSWWTTTFKSAIASFKHTVLILAPWHDPIPLTRAWCLYEIFCTVDTNSKFEIAMAENERESFISTILSDYSSISRMIATVDARKSTAWNLADKDRIFDVVEQTIGFDGINSAVFTLLRSWLISNIAARIQYLTSMGRDLDLETTRRLSVALAKVYRERQVR
jgi:hypothetical protein